MLKIKVKKVAVTLELNDVSLFILLATLSHNDFN